MKVSIIAAVGQNGEIGKDNDIIWKYPSDLKHFQETTNGSVVLMGRRTFESLDKPLANRFNIVITRNVLEVQSKLGNQGKAYTSISEYLKDHIKLRPQTKLYIVGGFGIYEECLEFANELILTRIPQTDNEADTFFPVVEYSHWTLKYQNWIDVKNNLTVDYYVRKC